MPAAPVCVCVFHCHLILTVDTTGLVAVVGTVVHLVALLGAVDAGAVATLELIRSTCQQGWATQRHTHMLEFDLHVILNCYCGSRTVGLIGVRLEGSGGRVDVP